ncbi:Pectin lyase-like superfamily protein [Citrus sinensis]|uniref:polygalacturonase-like n=1 Tax=Citrus sinensis TaxID=2711 RepID=UPI0021914958|nr:polygalacturonase-like [Citrus sinensis]KAH9726643.1 Pectin lyase-like superfamily protein [Citrus sinensis]
MDNKMCYFHFLISILLLSIFNTSSLAAPPSYNVVSFGAKPDGRTDSTKAFLSAWANACGSPRAATIYVPPGRFFLRNVAFQGPCKNNRITIRIDGTLVAPSDYRVIGNAGNWLFFQHVDGVTLNSGILDGQGTALWACKNSGKNCPSGATSMGFSNCNNIAINGLTSLNSQMYHVVFNGCNNVKLKGVKVLASGNSPNTDGIHVQLSSGVTILNTRISTGDDCVSIGPGTSNLWIENVACGPGHGISIGSLGKDLNEAGVQNVTVKTVTFTGTQNGLRIKSWGRPSNGFARNILFRNAIMKNVQNPIIIDQNYCPDNIGCPGQVSGVKISDVTYQDVHGTSATEVAVNFDCSSKYPCSRIRLEDVKLTYKNQPAAASCSHADGSASGLVQPKGCL